MDSCQQVKEPAEAASRKALARLAAVRADPVRRFPSLEIPEAVEFPPPRVPMGDRALQRLSS